MENLRSVTSHIEENLEIRFQLNPQTHTQFNKYNIECFRENVYVINASNNFLLKTYQKTTYKNNELNQKLVTNCRTDYNVQKFSGNTFFKL